MIEVFKARPGGGYDPRDSLSPKEYVSCKESAESDQIRRVLEIPGRSQIRRRLINDDMVMRVRNSKLSVSVSRGGRPNQPLRAASAVELPNKHHHHGHE